jgi:hypothetical protein
VLRPLLLATVFTAVVPASAGAVPTLTTGRACYAPEELIAFSGWGFTPSAKIVFVFGANGRFGQAETTAFPTGAFTYALNAPQLSEFNADSPTLDLLVTANDQSKIGPDGAIVGPPEESFAAAQFRLSEWSINVAKWNRDDATAKRGQTVKLVTRGWTILGPTVYAHYIRGGKAVHSQKIGALTGDCGDLTKKFKAFPFEAKVGTYAVRFSASARWTKKDPWLGYRAVRFVR